MTPAVDSARFAWWRSAVGVLAGALLFNLGQGVLRPTMPLYLQQVFSANYRMVTAIPTVFGAGKWVASLPTGYLLGRLGRRPLMVSGLLVIALSDVASVMTSAYGVFLGFRAIAGVGWAIVGPGLAYPDADHRPTFTKGKFAVPINQAHIKENWTARGYSIPKVTAYPAGWSRGEHTRGVSLIMTLITGRMEFIFAGHRVVVEPGDELLYPAHTVHAARNIYDGTTQMMESHK